MTKVSMRHLNEIVRERNQYSRDAWEAWQDLINLKGRMDTELAKVTQRNTFLVDELESWKQQFLKFQAFAEQLTTETNELKATIEGHKREHRRISTLLEHAQDDARRLTARAAATEQQRDDALEALVLQQEIAEELERARKRNTKDLAALQHTNATLLRQRDEAQRVVLHLRALIDGQAHHMEHIVKSLADADDAPSAPSSRASTRLSDRLSSLHEAPDVADRHLRHKTDAIAYIIRNISEQCAAAVEGLDLARRADSSEDASVSDRRSPSRRHTARSLDADDDDDDPDPDPDAADPDPRRRRPARHSSSVLSVSTTGPPPTPDLVADRRSSTSLSHASASTGAVSRRASKAPRAAASDHSTRIRDVEAELEEGDEAAAWDGAARGFTKPGAERVGEGRGVVVG